MMRIPRKAPFIYIRWSDGASVLLTAKKDITAVCIKANDEAIERFPPLSYMDWNAPRTVARGKISKLKIGFNGACAEWVFVPPMDEKLTGFFLWCEEQLQAGAA